MPLFRRIYRFTLLMPHLVAGVGVAVWCAMLAGVRPPGRSRAYRWWFARLCRILRLRVSARGQMSREAVFMVANHISWLDIVALGAVVPANFVSKAEVRTWPVFGWMAAAGGTVFIPRGDNQARAVADQVAARLDGGCSVVVFAEGTTSNGRQVRRFYPRLFAAAIDAGAPVQPVAVRFPHPEGVHPAAPFVDDDPFALSLRRILEAPEIEVELVFCSVVAAAGRDRRGLAVETREAIVCAYGLPTEEA